MVVVVVVVVVVTDQERSLENSKKYSKNEEHVESKKNDTEKNG